MHKKARLLGIKKNEYDNSNIKTCILLPSEDRIHEEKIFDSISIDERLRIHNGKYFDSSACRGFINFSKPKGFLTGRL